MPTYSYLIVGGGMTADAAVAGIRQVDSAGSIGLIGDEFNPPYDRPPLFAREGSVIALNTAEQHFAARADRRGFHVFPLTNGTFDAEIFDDDGESRRDGRYRLWRVRVACTDDAIDIAVSAAENGAPVACDAEIILPATERRAVTVDVPRQFD